MIVMKFGGSSVKTASAMRSVAEIVRTHFSAQPLVILSACGGITDKLLACADAASRAEHATLRTQLSAIREHHLSLSAELIEDPSILQTLREQLEQLLAELDEYCEGIALLCECTAQSLDAIASFGERLSTCIFHHYLLSLSLPSALHDARSSMLTNRNFTRATADSVALAQRAQQNILPLLQSGHCVVSQGFIGASADGLTTTLGRGGSDLSAALFGAALEAKEIQIWTDVSGVLSADPRIVQNTRSITSISFSEMRQLAYFGAKVLHPDTIKPAVDKAIPVRILNTFEPQHQGTTVVSDTHADTLAYDGLRAVSLLRGCALVRADVSMHEHATQVLAQNLSMAAQHSTDILLCFAEESSLGFVIRSKDTHLFEGHNRRISLCDVLCACGPHLSHSPALADINNALQSHAPDVILSGLSDVGVLALLSPDHSLQALQGLHEQLISKAA